MANNLSANTSEIVARKFAVHFNSDRVLSKAVDTQVMEDEFRITPRTGETVYLKRTPIYKAIETADGDITGIQKNDIAVGRASATVQPMITVPLSYSIMEEALSLDQMDELVKPVTEALNAQLELNIGQKMTENAGLTYGTPGTAVTKWSDVVGVSALANGIGMPRGADSRFYVMNDFSTAALAEAQSGLNSNDKLVTTAWEQAQIATPFGGVKALTSNAIKQYTSGASADRTGTLGATPVATFDAQKNTRLVTLVLNGLSASTADAVRPGDTIEVAGRYYINLINKQVVLGRDGSPVPYRLTVVTGGATDGSGNVTVTATAAPVYGNSGGQDEQYTSVSSPLTSGDAITILGSANTLYQPNLFFHKKAFALSTIKLPKLHATDTSFRTKDGIHIRITKYSDGDANAQFWRADILPVMGIIEPLFIGKAFGVPA